MSLTERVVQYVWEKVRDAVEGAAEDRAKSLFTEVIQRLDPTSRERAARKLLAAFSGLLHERFEDHQILTAEGENFAESTQLFLSNMVVQGWLAEPLDPEMRSLPHQRLAEMWREMNLYPLPDDFGWDIVARSYSLKVRKIVNEDADLRAAASHHAMEEVRKDMRRIAGLDPGFKLAEYRERIRARYGYLKFDSFHVTGSDLDRRVEKSKVFVPQHVKENLPPLELPKEHLRRLQEAGELSKADAKEMLDAEEYRKRYRAAEARNVVAVLDGRDCTKAVVVGDPGAGKSSLLEWMLLRWAANPGAHPFPLFVELRQIAREEDDWHGDFCQYFDAANDPLFAFNAEDLDHELRNSDCVLLLDGLDEVFDLEQRNRITERVFGFQGRYPRCRLVVTSRVLGFKREAWANAGFRMFTLQDFDETQIERFLDLWHQQAFAQDLDEIPRLQPRLLAAIREYAPIRELASNPLMLTMMAVVNRMEPIPRDRRALYGRCAELFAHRWDVNRGLMAGPEALAKGEGVLSSPLDLEDKKTLLERIAFAMQSGPHGLAGNVIEEEDLKKIVTDFLKESQLAQVPGEAARQVIQQLRGRNFILCFAGAGRYAFVHRTFLEFFSARYFAQRLEGSQIVEAVVKPHWADEKWHEVVRLVVAEKAKQEVVRAVVAFLLAQSMSNIQPVNVLLAADCLLDLRVTEDLDVTRDAVVSRLESAFDLNEHGFTMIPWDSRRKAARRWAALQPLTTSGFERLRSALEHQDWVVRLEAIGPIARGWKDNRDVRFALLNLAQHDPDSTVRSAAATELALNERS